MTEFKSILQMQEERLKNVESQLLLTKVVLNLDEVCKFTGLSKSHVYKLTMASKIPHYKQSKHLYFDRLEIEAWLKKHRIKPCYEIEQEATAMLPSIGREVNMFKAYFELVVLPNEVKAKHKLKLEPKNKRFDCIRSYGCYKGIEPFMNYKGMLFLFLSRANTIVNSSDERRADYILQNNSMNFSSIYTLLTPDLIGFAWGEPNNKELLSNGRHNPMYDFKDDGFLFIINPEYTRIELLIIEGGRFTIQAYLKQLAFGEFDEVLDKMRMNAKPFFEY